MSQEIVNTFKELVDRLKKENVQNGKLQNVFLIEGPEQEVLERRDLPAIIYELISSGVQTETCLGGWAKSEFAVLLTIHTKVANGYYNDEKTGILNLYESILNTIDIGGASLNGDGNWLDSPKYRLVGIEKTNLCYVYEVEILLASNKYKRGLL
jgi:hypothetical protein